MKPAASVTIIPYIAIPDPAPWYKCTPTGLFFRSRPARGVIIAKLRRFAQDAARQREQMMLTAFFSAGSC